MAPILEVQGLWKSYRAGVTGCRARVRVLQGLTFTLQAGERLLILGAPCSGKSTLLLCLAGLRRPDEGEIRWCESTGSACDWWRLRAEDPSEALRRTGQWPLLVDLGNQPPSAAWLGALAGGNPARGWIVVARHAGGLASLAHSVLELHEGTLRSIRATDRVRRVAEENVTAPLTLRARRL